MRRRNQSKADRALNRRSMKRSSLCEANVKAVGDELFELVEGVVEFVVEFARMYSASSSYYLAQHCNRSLVDCRSPA